MFGWMKKLFKKNEEKPVIVDNPEEYNTLEKAKAFDDGYLILKVSDQDSATIPLKMVAVTEEKLNNLCNEIFGLLGSAQTKYIFVRKTVCEQNREKGELKVISTETPLVDDVWTAQNLNQYETKIVDFLIGKSSSLKEQETLYLETEPESKPKKAPVSSKKSTKKAVKKAPVKKAVAKKAVKKSVVKKVAKKVVKKETTTPLGEQIPK